MSDIVATDVTETTATTTTEKVMIGVAVVSAAAFGVIYFRANRKLKAAKAAEADVHVVTDLEDENPQN